MSLFAKNSGKDFETCPAGLCQGVCVDVVDLGMVKSNWGEKHKCSIRWQTEHLDKEGRRILVVKRYSISLNEKATLRKDLETWRGRKFNEEELKNGFDLEKLIGQNCQLQVSHNITDGTTYANVDAIVPLAKGMTKLVNDGTYTRVQDREKNKSQAAPVDDDEEVPF